MCVCVSAVSYTHLDVSKRQDVCLVGMGNKIEVWSKERWETNVNSIGDDIDSVLSDMEELGFTI